MDAQYGTVQMNNDNTGRTALMYNIIQQFVLLLLRCNGFGGS